MYPRRKQREIWRVHVSTHTYTLQGAVWPQRQSGVLWPPAKECQQPSHTGRNRNKISPAECEGQGHGFSPVRLRINFCCLKATQFVTVCYSSPRSWLQLLNSSLNRKSVKDAHSPEVLLDHTQHFTERIRNLLAIPKFGQFFLVVLGYL